MRELEAVRQEAVLLQDQMKGIKQDVEKVNIDCVIKVEAYNRVLSCVFTG